MLIFHLSFLETIYQLARKAETGYALSETIAALGMPEGGARRIRVIA